MVSQLTMVTREVQGDAQSTFSTLGTTYTDEELVYELNQTINILTLSQRRRPRTQYALERGSESLSLRPQTCGP